MEVGVVTPVGPGREENLLASLKCLGEQTKPPRIVVVVCDGPESGVDIQGFNLPLAILRMPEKHTPGMEQPRNLGVRMLTDLVREQPGFADLSHVWFLDSDVIVKPDCLEMYEQAMQHEPIDRILVGPYEWLPPGVREPMEDLRNDFRQASFDAHEPWEMRREDLAAGLACFSGNLIWPIEEFTRAGGFWNELHHGRCEDGELGLRAVSMGIPISFVREARGWHLDHERNHEWIAAANARDVPMIDGRHPWLQGEGVFVEESDGSRFEVECPNCGSRINTGEIWGHMAGCPARAAE